MARSFGNIAETGPWRESFGQRSEEVNKSSNTTISVSVLDEDKRTRTGRSTDRGLVESVDQQSVSAVAREETRSKKEQSGETDEVHGGEGCGQKRRVEVMQGFNKAMKVQEALKELLNSSSR